MAIKLQNIKYLSLSDVLGEIGITRQTLWRWRQEGKVPAGHRLRNRMVVFSPEEVEEIRAYANQLEPIASPAGAMPQLSLFARANNGAGGKP
ncbi:MAG: helix-turn-helix transcriptional regulator [Pseudohaliea sp.]